MPNNIIARKIKFNSKISDESTLVYGVSKDNSNQTGDNFQSFVSWIIDNKNKKLKLKIIISDWLHRFYVGEEEAWKWGEQWEASNKASLDKLKNTSIDCQINSWREVIKNKNYSGIKSIVDGYFASNKAFREIVEALAKSHQHKKDLQAAIDYLLEEAAGIASLGEAILTYPASELNGAVQWVLKELDHGLDSSIKLPIFKGHMLVPNKMPYNAKKNLDTTAFKLVCAFVQNSITKKEDAIKYLFDALCVYETNKNLDAFLNALNATPKANQFEVFVREKNTEKDISLPNPSVIVSNLKPQLNKVCFYGNTLQGINTEGLSINTLRRYSL